MSSTGMHLLLLFLFLVLLVLILIFSALVVLVFILATVEAYGSQADDDWIESHSGL